MLAALPHREVLSAGGLREPAQHFSGLLILPWTSLPLTSRLTGKG